MNLRQRTLLAIGLTTVCLTAGVFVFSRGPLLSSYVQLEAQDATQDVQRAQNGIQSQVKNLNDKITDWAQWDDAYHFMADRGAAFIGSNLKVVSMPVDSILFVDKDGALWYDRPVSHPGKKAPDSQELRQALRFDRPISERPAQGGPFSGLVRVGDGLFNVSVSPISDTENKAPKRGWLVFAQRLDNGELNRLRQDVHLDVRLFDLTGLHLPADCRASLGKLSNSQPTFVSPLDDEVVASYAYLKDVFGKPVRLIRVTQPRYVYRQGVDGVRHLEILVLISAVLFAVVIVAVLEVATLSRVSSLSEQVDWVGVGGARRRVSLRGKDELARLATKINAMLAKLDESATRIRQSEEQLRVYSEGLEQLVAERTRELAAKNAVLAHAVEGISRLDDAGDFVSVNAAFAKIAGYRREEMAGMNWGAIVHPSDHAKFRGAIHEMERIGKSECEVAGLRLDGSRTYLEIVLIASRDEAGRSMGHYCFAKDISDRKKLEGQIEHQVFHDALTGLPNRLLFMDRLVQAEARAGRSGRGVAVLFFDLDNFKVINDSSGHEAGDILLRSIAERMVRCVRPEDTVARCGGDEFAILIEDIQSADEPVAVAEQIIASLQQPIALPRGEVVVTTSIGIACSASWEASPEELMRDADTAMYKAKESGKAGYAFFDPSMNAEAVQRMELEIGLRRALEQDEMGLLYQPLIDLRTGKLNGVEALVRWYSPTGVVSPSQFIAIAEETGLIVPLGRWVLLEACRRMKSWLDEEMPNCPETMSVNLSGKQLQRADIIEQISEILKQTGLPPERLKLEITESVLMSDMGDALAKMHLLREMGIKLAIDDFGTGYSSVSNLSSFPVNTVKIDRAFVSRLAEEDEAAGIIAGIMMISKTMRLEVTAEGIEDADQLRYLLALGCNTGQGYYFARPLEEARLREEWFHRERPAA